MVDDRIQRPFGSNEPARGPTTKPSGNDPLAELARLIGQSDPFGEYGNARRASAPPAHEPPPAWSDESQNTPQPAAPAAPPAPNYFASPSPQIAAAHSGRQTFGAAPAHDPDLYHVANTVPGYGGHDASGYDPANPPPLGENYAADQGDYYEDEQPSRRRMMVLVAAGVFALAVVGTAGAFGYRALFGASSVSGPPPVIKADTTPSKVVPASATQQSSKQITDRINDTGVGEKMVSREETPVPITPQEPPAAAAQASSPPMPGSGVVGAEPKKIRTIAIRPDQGMAEQPAQAAALPAPAPPAPAAAAPPVRVVPTSKPAAPARAANNAPRAGDTANNTADDEQAAAPARPARAQAPAARSANAPLSLSPDAAPARAAAPARTASLAPAASSGGGYLVQLTSQRSEAEAQSAFASLQSKFPSQLGGKQAVIRKVELNGKGTYYRAMVSAGDAASANQLCSGIKAAGGSCLVQKN